MTTSEFAGVAESLRDAVASDYRRRGREATSSTLDTNSVLIEGRANSLIRALEQADEPPSIRGQRIVDLGCGFGAVALYLAHRGAEVTAVDPERRFLRAGRAVAEEHGLPVEFVEGTMQDVDLPEGSFDLAVQHNSLCYVIAPGERLRALRHTRDLLRPGGHLLTRNPNRLNPIDPFSGLPLVHLLEPAAAVRVAGALGRDRPAVRFMSPRRARRELQAAGFGGIRHVATRRRPGPGWLKSLEGYHDIVARRPPLAHPQDRTYARRGPGTGASGGGFESTAGDDRRGNPRRV